MGGQHRKYSDLGDNNDTDSNSSKFLAFSKEFLKREIFAYVFN